MSHYTHLQRVQLMLEAINAVKQRVTDAQMEGDRKAYLLAGEELIYLESILVTEAQLLVDYELGLLSA